ncbi:hypothetical protein VQL36_14710 [Chengkuizengella sp. SCS-71B]|uniref:hypothetical protein n=1 Tax=Chengkuizengella sp. SCS-71B TaxID=3115290 RepID=UPI0032C24A54
MKNTRLSILLFISILIGLTGCGATQSNNQKQAVEFVEDRMYIMISDLETEYLFSIACKIKNNTNEALGPFYMKYIFHDDRLSNILEREESNIQQDVGLEPYTLEAGEPLICGDSISVELDKTNYDEFYSIIKDKKSIEVQLFHIDAEHIIANYFINEIKPLQYEKKDF